MFIHYPEIVVFIEKIELSTNNLVDKTYSIILDFPFQENINLSSRTRFFQSIQQGINTNLSMLEISNVRFEKGGKPREGSYYVLPEEFINLEWNPVSEEDNVSSNFIALKADASKATLSFSKAQAYRRYSQNIDSVTQNIWDLEVDPVLRGFSKEPKEINVTVYDVGQGNWNEIIFNDEALLIYDIGSATPQKLSKKLKKVLTQLTRKFRLNQVLNTLVCDIKIVLVVSHWDIDHYNGIFSLPDKVIMQIKFCIVPNRIENMTTKRAIDRLQNLTNVYPIAMAPKMRGVYGASTLHQIFSSNLIKIYKGTNCNDRNKRGLVVSLHTGATDFIFTGDHHYHQIDRNVLPNCTSKNFNTVVPHHGGKAGSLRSVIGWSNCEDAVISSGGRYGHPLPRIENLLNNIFNNTHRTDRCSDYTKRI